MSGPLSDDLFAPLLIQLRDCVCAQLARTPRGPVCRCYLTYGLSSPPMDGCICDCVTAGTGDGWVRLVRVETAGLLDFNALPSCDLGWDVIVELGAARCVPMSEDGDPLTADILNSSSLDALADLRALLRVRRCCDALKDMTVVTEVITPLGSVTSGCYAATVQLRVSLSVGQEVC